MRALRKLKGWNQEQLAEVAGVEQPTISRIERGDTGVTLRNLYNVATALGVPLYQLFTEDAEALELEIIKVYRSLSDERKQGWLDMLKAVSAQNQTKDQ